MTFEQLGRKFQELDKRFPGTSAERVDGRWVVRGPEGAEPEFTKLAATGARMLGFVGSDENAMGYWCNRLNAGWTPQERN